MFELYLGLGWRLGRRLGFGFGIGLVFGPGSVIDWAGDRTVLGAKICCWGTKCPPFPGLAFVIGTELELELGPGPGLELEPALGLELGTEPEPAPAARSNNPWEEALQVLGDLGDLGDPVDPEGPHTWA